MFNFIKKSMFVLSMVAVLMVVSGCSNQATNNQDQQLIDIVDSTGRQVQVPFKPERVVALDLGTIDSLQYLGIEIIGMPQGTQLPSNLAHLDGNVSNVGGLRDIDIEAIYLLQPDIIFIHGRQEEIMEQLEQIAPVVFVRIDYTNYLDSVASNFRILGQIFDKENQVNTVIEEITNTANEVETLAQHSGKRALITFTNESNLGVFGPDSRFSIIHKNLGFEAVDPTIEASRHSMLVNVEYVQEKNPDVIFVIDRQSAIGGEAMSRTILNNELITNTNAGQNNRIIFLDSGVWYLADGGINSTRQMIEEVKSALQ